MIRRFSALPRGASLNFPPAQSSASGELFRA
jgi:hypothetical protein